MDRWRPARLSGIGLIALPGGCATRPVNPAITQVEPGTGCRDEGLQVRGKAPCRAFAALAALLVVGCTTIGPATIPRDRFDYAAAISDSWKNQMLLNLVKARYGDAPVFLDIASAINSYSIETDVSVAAGFQTPLASNANTLGLGAGSKFTDRPTITYSPLIGEKFSKSLMTPIPPGALLALMQTGWKSELLLRCCVHSINGFQTLSQRSMGGPPADAEFARIIGALDRIQQAGGLGMRVVREKEGSGTVLFFPPRAAGPSSADIAEVEQLLGIKVKAGEFRVTYGTVPRGDQEIAILTRSMLEILIDMASYIDVPAAHVAEHRAAPGFADTGGASGGLKPLIRVYSGTERPGDAFVAIRYRDTWFWIDDRDLPSKSVFSFLMFLFTLTESGGGQVSPVLTVPAG